MLAFPRFASALDYPTRPVRFVVAFFAGSLSDILARTIADGLSKQLSQQIIVDDQPGAGGNLATYMVVRAPPDGYTLLEATSANVWNAALYDKLSFDFIRDIAPVASISRTPAVMAVTQSFPAKTVPEFIAYAKENPGKVNMASGGIGSLPHVAGELFKFMTGMNLIHVPYRGSYLPDLIGGQVQVAFGPIPTLIEQIRADKLRALAVTGAEPSAALPDLPTLGQFVPGYEASAFNGVGVPKKTPIEIIYKLNAAAGGKLVAMYGTMVDGPGAMAIVDVDPGVGAAIAAVVASSDGVCNVRTQRLFSMDEVIAIRKKRIQLQASYSPPGE